MLDTTLPFTLNLLLSVTLAALTPCLLSGGFVCYL